MANQLANYNSLLLPTFNRLLIFDGKILSGKDFKEGKVFLLKLHKF